MDAQGNPVFKRDKDDDDDDDDADKTADGVGVVDVATHKLVKKISVGSDPEEFDISQDGKRLYVSNEDVKTASAVDVANGKVESIVPLTQEPEGVAVTPDVSLETTPLDQCIDLPSTILRYVARMKEPLVLSDAATADAFAADPAVRQRNLRSILCVPLVGLLYLENDAMAGAFAGERVEVAQVLAAQAVSSLENARLHQESFQEIEQRKQAEQALNEADRRKDEFLAMLAHELRNPLAPIGSASEVLARRLSGDASVQSAIGIIRRQVTQMTRLVDALLDVSRVTQGRIQLTCAPIDLSNVITHAVETVDLCCVPSDIACRSAPATNRSMWMATLPACPSALETS